MVFGALKSLAKAVTGDDEAEKKKKEQQQTSNRAVNAARANQQQAQPQPAPKKEEKSGGLFGAIGGVVGGVVNAVTGDDKKDDKKKESGGGGIFGFFTSIVDSISSILAAPPPSKKVPANKATAVGGPPKPKTSAPYKEAKSRKDAAKKPAPSKKNVKSAPAPLAVAKKPAAAAAKPAAPTRPLDDSSLQAGDLILLAGDLKLPIEDDQREFEQANAAKPKGKQQQTTAFKGRVTTLSAKTEAIVDYVWPDQSAVYLRLCYGRGCKLPLTMDPQTGELNKFWVRVASLRTPLSHFRPVCNLRPTPGGPTDLICDGCGLIRWQLINSYTTKKLSCRVPRCNNAVKFSYEKPVLYCPFCNDVYCHSHGVSACDQQAKVKEAKRIEVETKMKVEAATADVMELAAEELAALQEERLAAAEARNAAAYLPRCDYGHAIVGNVLTKRMDDSNEDGATSDDGADPLARYEGVPCSSCGAEDFQRFYVCGECHTLLCEVCRNNRTDVGKDDDMKVMAKEFKLAEGSVDRLKKDRDIVKHQVNHKIKMDDVAKMADGDAKEKATKEATEEMESIMKPYRLSVAALRGAADAKITALIRSRQEERFKTLLMSKLFDEQPVQEDGDDSTTKKLDDEDSQTAVETEGTSSAKATTVEHDPVSASLAAGPSATENQKPPVPPAQQPGAVPTTRDGFLAHRNERLLALRTLDDDLVSDREGYADAILESLDQYIKTIQETAIPNLKADTPFPTAILEKLPKALRWLAELPDRVKNVPSLAASVSYTANQQRVMMFKGAYVLNTLLTEDDAARVAYCKEKDVGRDDMPPLLAQLGILHHPGEPIDDELDWLGTMMEAHVSPVDVVDILFAAFVYTVDCKDCSCTSVQECKTRRKKDKAEKQPDHRKLPPAPGNFDAHGWNAAPWSIMNWSIRAAHAPWTKEEVRAIALEAIPVYRPLAERLEECLAVFPKKVDAFFRGVDVPKLSLKYKLGTTINWDPFSSTSMVGIKALGYCKPRGTFFVVQAFTPAVIAFMSWFPHEAEALLNTFTQFRVLSKMSTTLLQMLGCDFSVVTMCENVQEGSVPDWLAVQAVLRATKQTLFIYKRYLQHYIEATVKAPESGGVISTPTPLFEKIAGWLAGPRPRLALLGLSGSGKTSASLAVLSWLMSTPNQHFFPIYIPLPRVPTVFEEGAIDKYIAGSLNLTRGQLDYLRTSRVIVLLLDSLDEVADIATIDEDDRQLAIQRLIDRNPWAASVRSVVSCRHEFVENYNLDQQALICTDAQRVDVALIQPFQQTDIEEYMIREAMIKATDGHRKKLGGNDQTLFWPPRCPECRGDSNPKEALACQQCRVLEAQTREKIRTPQTAKLPKNVPRRSDEDTRRIAIGTVVGNLGIAGRDGEEGQKIVDGVVAEVEEHVNSWRQLLLKGGYSDILSNPFLLYMVIVTAGSTNPDASMEKVHAELTDTPVFGKYELYQAYFNAVTPSVEARSMACEIAKKMAMRGRWVDLRSLYADSDDARVTFSLLPVRVEDGEGDDAEFSFRHKSLHEFLVASELYRLSVKAVMEENCLDNYDPNAHPTADSLTTSEKELRTVLDAMPPLMHNLAIAKFFADRFYRDSHLQDHIAAVWGRLIMFDDGFSNDDGTSEAAKKAEKTSIRVSSNALTMLCHCHYPVGNVARDLASKLFDQVHTASGILSFCNIAKTVFRKSQSLSRADWSSVENRDAPSEEKTIKQKEHEKKMARLRQQRKEEEERRYGKSKIETYDKDTPTRSVIPTPGALNRALIGNSKGNLYLYDPNIPVVSEGERDRWGNPVPPKPTKTLEPMQAQLVCQSNSKKPIHLVGCYFNGVVGCYNFATKEVRLHASVPSHLAEKEPIQLLFSHDDKFILALYPESGVHAYSVAHMNDMSSRSFGMNIWQPKNTGKEPTIFCNTGFMMIPNKPWVLVWGTKPSKKEGYGSDSSNSPGSATILDLSDLGKKTTFTAPQLLQEIGAALKTPSVDEDSFIEIHFSPQWVRNKRKFNFHVDEISAMNNLGAAENKSGSALAASVPVTTFHEDPVEGIAVVDNIVCSVSKYEIFFRDLTTGVHLFGNPEPMNEAAKKDHTAPSRDTEWPWRRQVLPHPNKKDVLLLGCVGVKGSRLIGPRVRANDRVRFYDGLHRVLQIRAATGQVVNQYASRDVTLSMNILPVDMDGKRFDDQREEKKAAESGDIQYLLVGVTQLGAVDVWKLDDGAEDGDGGGVQMRDALKRYSPKENTARCYTRYGNANRFEADLPIRPIAATNGKELVVITEANQKPKTWREDNGKHAQRLFSHYNLPPNLLKPESTTQLTKVKEVSWGLGDMDKRPGAEETFGAPILDLKMSRAGEVVLVSCYEDRNRDQCIKIVSSSDTGNFLEGRAMQLGSHTPDGGVNRHLRPCISFIPITGALTNEGALAFYQTTRTMGTLSTELRHANAKKAIENGDTSSFAVQIYKAEMEKREKMIAEGTDPTALDGDPVESTGDCHDLSCFSLANSVDFNSSADGSNSTSIRRYGMAFHSCAFVKTLPASRNVAGGGGSGGEMAHAVSCDPRPSALCVLGTDTGSLNITSPPGPPQKEELHMIGPAKSLGLGGTTYTSTMPSYLRVHGPRPATQLRGVSKHSMPKEDAGDDATEDE